MSPARARTRSARSGVERANHEATVPPTLRQNYKLINDKQSILNYIRLPGDFRLIKGIGHASFASSAVFLFCTCRHIYMPWNSKEIVECKCSVGLHSNRLLGSTHGMLTVNRPLTLVLDSLTLASEGLTVVASTVFRLRERRTGLQCFIPYHGRIVCSFYVKNQCFLSRR